MKIQLAYLTLFCSLSAAEQSGLQEALKLQQQEAPAGEPILKIMIQKLFASMPPGQKLAYISGVTSEGNLRRFQVKLQENAQPTMYTYNTDTQEFAQEQPQ